MDVEKVNFPQCVIDDFVTIGNSDYWMTKSKILKFDRENQVKQETEIALEEKNYG